MKPHIYYDVEKTLKSFGLTKYEFYNMLNSKLTCSGIRNVYPKLSSADCQGVYCHDCPLSKLRTDRERKLWLGLITKSGDTITEELKRSPETIDEPLKRLQTNKPPFFEDIQPTYFGKSEFDKINDKVSDNKKKLPKSTSEVIKPVKEKTLEQRMTILENQNKRILELLEKAYKEKEII